MSQKSIKKNMVMSIILTISNFLFPLITYSYISRTLGPTGVGKVAFAASIITYFAYLASLGIPLYGLREVAKLRNDKKKLTKLIKELLTLNLIFCVISYLLLIPCVLLIPSFSTQKIIFFIISMQIILECLGMEWVYKGLEEYSYITTRSLIFKLIYVPLTFLLIRNSNDIVWYAFLTIFVTSANYICNFINIRKHIDLKTKTKLEIKKHFKPIFTLFFAVAIINIYANFDISMIGIIKGDYYVGLYNSALKIKAIILSLSTAITAVLIPRISYYIGKKKYDDVKKLSLLSLKTTMLLAVPISIFAFIYAKEVLLFLCGSAFIKAASTLRVLMLCVIVLCLTNLFGNQLLIPFGKEKRYTISVIVSLFINLSLNFLLIPTYGSYGAAIGTLVTEIWNAIYMGYGVKEYVAYVFKNTKLLEYALCLFIASSSSYLISTMLNCGVFIKLSIIGIIFMAIYYLLIIVFRVENLQNLFSNLKENKNENE